MVGFSGWGETDVGGTVAASLGVDGLDAATVDPAGVAFLATITFLTTFLTAPPLGATGCTANFTPAFGPFSDAFLSFRLAIWERSEELLPDDEEERLLGVLPRRLWDL